MTRRDSIGYKIKATRVDNANKSMRVSVYSKTMTHIESIDESSEYRQVTRRERTIVQNQNQYQGKGHIYSSRTKSQQLLQMKEV